MGGRVVVDGPSDLALLARLRAGDWGAAKALIVRHTEAIERLERADARGHRSIDGSSSAVIDWAESTAAVDLPFRAAWLAHHVRGSLPADEHDADHVWSAFKALPSTWRVAIWHREVEGQDAGTIGRYLDLEERDATRALVSAYSAMKRSVAAAHARPDAEKDCQAIFDTFRYSPPAVLERRQVAVLRDHGRACDDCIGLVRDLFRVEHTLGAALAEVVLGDAAGEYLATRRRPGRLRVARPDRAPVPVKLRSALAVLTAASLSAAATSFVLLGQPDGVPGFDRDVPSAGAGLAVPAEVIAPRATTTSRAVHREAPDAGSAGRAGTRAEGGSAGAGAPSGAPVSAPGSSAGGGGAAAPTDGGPGAPTAPTTPGTPSSPPAGGGGPSEPPPVQPEQPKPQPPRPDGDPPPPSAGGGGGGGGGDVIVVDGGGVTVDPGLPTGPIEVELPVQLPLPEVKVPGLPGGR